jgi:eukaryotic-like serine/threonine-protein kinase
MDREHWQRVERVLDVALESDPARWPTLLDESCRGDAGLRRDVESLLGRYSSVRRYLTQPPAAAAAALVAEARSADAIDRFIGRRVASWTVVRQVGQSGLARVYLGERADGLAPQRVAIKMLRADFGGGLDRRRFRADRQAVATIDHSGVARLLDGGITDDGRPFLVVEYVEGEPIDRYCAHHTVSVRQRLVLFLDVAEAVQAAHRSVAGVGAPCGRG